MTREQFTRLTPGSRCYTHVGTSYRQVTVVSIDLAAGVVECSCRAIGHGGRLLTCRRRFGEVDRRPYKPYAGMKFKDEQRFAARAIGRGSRKGEAHAD